MKLHYMAGAAHNRPLLSQNQLLRRVAVVFLAVSLFVCGAIAGDIAAHPGNPYQITPHMLGAPLPSGSNAPRQSDFAKRYSDWLTRVILGHFTANKDPAGADLIKSAIAYLSAELPYGPPRGLMRAVRARDISKVTDPGLLIMISSIETDIGRQRDAASRAVELFPASNYPKFLWFTAAAQVGRVDSDAHVPSAQLDADDKISLKYLNEGLCDDSFLQSEMAALRWRFDSRSFRDLLSRHGQEIVKSFEGAPNIDRWLKDYVEGVEFVSEAWSERGAGWTGSISAKSWRGFYDDLAFARVHLAASWKENPHEPAAAAEMITVCMGESEQTDTMRSWFDRSVAADFDYMPAYTQYLWGLRPRWLGSYAEMNAFGEECAATLRYDTQVPNTRVAAAVDVSDDSNDGGEQFRDPVVANQVLTVLDTYFAQPVRGLRSDFSHTIAAIVAYKSGRSDEMVRHLAAINFKPVVDPRFQKMTDLNQLIGIAKKANATAEPYSASGPADSVIIPGIPDFAY
jgi:hypothetical protein